MPPTNTNQSKKRPPSQQNTPGPKTREGQWEFFYLVKFHQSASKRCAILVRRLLGLLYYANINASF